MCAEPTGYIPFYSEIAKLARLDTRFFVPGHKGRGDALPFLGGAAKFDLTEIDGACDLQHPAGPLAESEHLMAGVFGSAHTLYSAAGSTACIEAMLHLHTAPGKPVIMARGCHAAAVRSLCFTGAVPVWLPLANGLLSPDTLAAALEKYPGAPVYVTSPDYYGHVQDVRALSEICHAHGGKLLVDNAHGAYLRFLRPDIHPITLGADAACDSAHKTLPCVTPGALLHLGAADEAAATAARRALNLYSSTSPSYLVLASLAWLAGLLSQCPPNFEAAAARLATAVKAANAGGIVRQSADRLRLCLDPAMAGLPTAPLEQAFAAGGILPEYTDGRCVALMASPYNTDENFAQLTTVLANYIAKFAGHTSFIDNSAHDSTETEKICRANGADAPHMRPLPPQPQLPEVACTPREAFWTETETVSLAAAVGRVAAFIEAPCPPGVPPVVPGEVLDEAAATLYAAAGILAVDVVK